MLSFTEQLKELIFNIEKSGGSAIQKITPPGDLILKLKSRIIKQLRKETEPLPRRVEYFLVEEFNEGFFEEGIRVSLVHLNEMGITDLEEVFEILCNVVDKRLDDILNRNKKHNQHTYNRSISTNDAIIKSIEYVWEEYGSESTILYNFAKQRFLILWDYRINCWKTTGLGRFLLELKPLQAITFLLTIDLSFNTGERDIRHISYNELKTLNESNDKHSTHIIPLHIEMLKLLGVIRIFSDSYRDYEITPLGKAVVESVLAKENPMNEIVTALIQNEEQGINFEGSEKELGELKNQLSSEMIEKGTRESIENAIALYRKGSYTDSSRIFFPSIESIANQMLSVKGEDPNDHKKFPGLVRKINKLEELKVIPNDLSKGIEIAYSRNKVLHGEYEPLEQEYAYPLCIAAIIYLRRMLKEFQTK